MKKSYDEFRRNLLVDIAGKEFLRREGYDMKVSRARTRVGVYLVSVKTTKKDFERLIGKLEIGMFTYVVFERCL